MTTQSTINEVAATSNTIEEIGYPTDIKKAIAEYIWNWFDARATTINIDFKINDQLENIESFSISDNGDGIVCEDLETTFRPILDSPKKEFNASFYTRWRRGKGRFSFLSFSQEATWDTIYKNSWESKKYKITIASSQKHKFLNTNPIIVLEETGTKVEFFNFQKDLTKDFLEWDEFMNFLKFEFCWFLHLHKSSDFKIIVNGIELDFESVIQDSSIVEEDIEDSGKVHKFSIYYIQWNNKIGEDSQNYYLNSLSKPQWNEDNWTNKKGDNFFNSLYIKSSFFDSFEVLQKKPTQDSIIGFEKPLNSNYSEVFRKLSKKLENFLLEKKKIYLKAKGNLLVEKLYQEWVMPQFWSWKYEALKKEDFEEIVKEIYIFEPQIFEKNGNKKQKQTILSFLKLLLDDDKREYVVSVMQWILELTEEQVKEFSTVLGKTKFSGIVKLGNLIIGRQELILQLKKLVFDLDKFTTEREHIQKIVEKNYWLFWEQYSMVSADKNFAVLKSKYEEFTKWNASKKTKIEKDEDKRRPDIFLARTRDLPQHNQNNTIMEHIIVELKRPTQNIWSEQFRQIEDYMEYIKNDPVLWSKLNTWKFYLIWEELKSYITDKYEPWDDPFLIHQSQWIYRIYALKWSDLFRIFENSHKHLLIELDLDDNDLLEKLGLLELPPNIDTVDTITENILKK